MWGCLCGRGIKSDSGGEGAYSLSTDLMIALTALLSSAMMPDLSPGK